MPATVAKQGEVYRVVEAIDGSLVRGPSGDPVDGGGHATRAAAQAQAAAINATKDSFVVDRGRLGKARPGPAGSVIVSAQIGRIGVQQYMHGSDLRHPEDVFSAASIDSLVGAPVTRLHPRDDAGNPCQVTPDNARAFGRGHVQSARVDGEWIVADLVITDAETQAAIDSGELSEVSCGYNRSLEAVAGVWDGTRFAFRQREIVYNHVALGPKNWARAGRDARLVLDGELMKILSYNAQTGRLVFDGKEYDPGDSAQLKAVKALVRAQAGPGYDQLDTAAVVALADEMRGHVDGLNATIAMLAEMLAAETAEPATMTVEQQAEQDVARDAVRDRARRLVVDYDPNGKSIETIVNEVLTAKEYDFAGKSDGYRRGVFDSLPVTSSSFDGLGTVLGSGAGAPRDDLQKKRADARKAALERNRKARGLA